LDILKGYIVTIICTYFTMK